MRIITFNVNICQSSLLSLFKFQILRTSLYFLNLLMVKKKERKKTQR